MAVRRFPPPRHYPRAFSRHMSQTAMTIATSIMRRTIELFSITPPARKIPVN
jgi:hypothetical protein